MTGEARILISGSREAASAVAIRDQGALSGNRCITITEPAAGGLFRGRANRSPFGCTYFRAGFAVAASGRALMLSLSRGASLMLILPVLRVQVAHDKPVTTGAWLAQIRRALGTRSALIIIAQLMWSKLSIKWFLVRSAHSCTPWYGSLKSRIAGRFPSAVMDGSSQEPAHHRPTLAKKPAALSSACQWGMARSPTTTPGNTSA